ncbi:MAG: G8 domain-containing protein [Verrucomicrobiota bacterium]|nr:G8 domain-containing protein [Verrucomicrobiota bacterium]
MSRSSLPACFLFALSLLPLKGADEAVKFVAVTAESGRWSDPKTWEGQRAPRAGDFVQVRRGHAIIYDVESSDALRMVHVAGKLSFSRACNTRLDVGLLKISDAEETTEDGFNCHDAPAPSPTLGAAGAATLEIGTAAEPIPAGRTAVIRLVYFAQTDRESFPAIVNCGGRWEVHGAPLSRTWLKLGAGARPGDREVTLSEPVTGWRKGDRVIVTASKEVYGGGTYRGNGKNPKRGQTEERMITEIAGAKVTLDQPLAYEHFGTGDFRSEVANLSRNVIIESADPAGARGHTMFHRDSTGGISYAEFRHLGKEGVLGRYALHFHLVRETMRGRGVIGASIWDSHNRWLTIHGTDYLLVRDCVGYQSVGHGFYLEDGTEQYNVFDRNLAVQAYRGKRLPKQVLAFDPNDGAGFWWANGRNTFVRNVACENDEYGFRFEIAKRGNFNPVLHLRAPDGTRAPRDVRTIPFLRFEDNESHSEGLYSFNFGDDANPSVRGDRQHPFIARNLKAWETHYAIRPNVQFFLLEGLRVDHAAYGVYHPDYDAHVYRDIHLNRVNGEPINRGHDDESIQYGTFTYDGLTIENSRTGRDPLIQLACTSPRPDAAGHFRNLVLKNSVSRQGKVVDLGGGPRNPKLQHAVPYFFHGYFTPGSVTTVMSAKFPDQLNARFNPIDGFTGRDVRAADAGAVAFPELLDPIDDLPPATLITSARLAGSQMIVTGVSHDNGEIASIHVNGVPARPLAAYAGVVDWTATLESIKGDTLSAYAVDRDGNREQIPATWPTGADRHALDGPRSSRAERSGVEGPGAISRPVITAGK